MGRLVAEGGGGMRDEAGGQGANDRGLVAWSGQRGGGQGG